MKIGIIELLVATPTNRWSPGTVGNYLITKQYASIMPQTIAAWCRQLGHQTFYATYFGQKDPKRLLPSDLDVVFISAYTQASALAYALAKLYRSESTLTVLGGPHAKAFPDDSLRFFDLVVRECDRTLVADILSGTYDPGNIVSSARPLQDVASVEERMPEIRASAFTRGRPYISTTIPMLSSIGCPYACDFCTDWDNPFALLPPDRLEADLRYLSTAWPGVRVSFHDPNFGVKFDAVIGLMETIPRKAQNPYVIESTLSLLQEPRLQRLHDTGCFFLAPGVESWSSYSNKAGVGRTAGYPKVERLADHFELLHQYVPCLQANFMFGLDVDEGDEPAELTKEFMRRTPFVWPVINIPTPFGGTPLYEAYMEQSRILRAMPLAFYYSPYLVTTLKNYGPIDYYTQLIDVSGYAGDRSLWWQRMRSASNWSTRMLMSLRALRVAQRVREFQTILKMLTTDSQFLAFHEGRSAVLPQFYHKRYESRLGPYAALLSPDDRTPVMVSWHREPAKPELVGGPAAVGGQQG